MFCENCGKEIQEDAGFCPECGHRINGGNNGGRVEAVSQTVFPDNQPDLHNGKKKKMTAVLIIIAVVVILGVAAAVFFLVRKDDTPKSSGERQTSMADEMPDRLDHTDIETYLDKSVVELEELGFAEQDDLTYENADGTIWFDEADGEIGSIFMETGCRAPFHDVEITDTPETAKEKLSDEYELITEADGELLFGNRDKKTAVVVSCSGETIETICIMRNYEFEEADMEDGSEYIFPDSDKKYLSEDEIRSVEVDKMALGRNEIFARHGYIFSDETYRQYFESLSWYEGTIPSDEFNAEEEFNDFEMKNVELIKQIEDEVNGVQAQNSEQQAAIDSAYDFLVGHSFNYEGWQLVIEFQTEDTVRICYGGEILDDYFDYSITARYELYRDDQKEWLTYITINGVEYYLRCLTGGNIDLAGDGEFSGWYNMVQ